MDKKEKKKRLQFHQILKKKIDTSSLKHHGKKSFSVDKKKPFRGNKKF